MGVVIGRFLFLGPLWSTVLFPWHWWPRKHTVQGRRLRNYFQILLSPRHQKLGAIMRPATKFLFSSFSITLIARMTSQTKIGSQCVEAVPPESVDPVEISLSCRSSFTRTTQLCMPKVLGILTIRNKTQTLQSAARLFHFPDISS